MTTGKAIALTIWTFIGKVMSLLFNTLSRFVIAFLPRSNRLLMSWLQSPSSVILEPKKRKSVTASTFSLSTCQEVMGPDVMILGFFSFFLSFFFNIEAFFFQIIYGFVFGCTGSLLTRAAFLSLRARATLYFWLMGSRVRAQ